MKNRKKKNKTKLKMVLLSVMTGLLLIGVSALVVVNLFVVKNVVVEGNVLYDDEVITSTVLNDKYSTNSLYVLLKYTFTETEKLPFIDAMEIRMENPSTLHITVYEKGMLGYLHIAPIDEYAYFDKDGFVTETSDRIIEGVPEIVGLSCEQIVLYEKLPVEEKKLKDLLRLTQALKGKEIHPRQIRFDEKAEPVLIWGDLEVKMGSLKYLTPKVEHIKGILNEYTQLKGILHLELWDDFGTNIWFETAE